MINTWPHWIIIPISVFIITVLLVFTMLVITEVGL